MKKEYYYKKQDDGKIRNVRKLNIVDKILLSAGFTLLVLFLFIQGMIFSPSNKDYFKDSGSYDGKPVSEKEVLYRTGSLVLKADNYNFDKIKIYVNGEFYSTFSSPEMEVPVKENSVVELDSAGETGEFTVQVTGVSGVVSSDYLGRVIELHEDKKTIYR